MAILRFCLDPFHFSSSPSNDLASRDGENRVLSWVPFHYKKIHDLSIVVQIPHPFENLNQMFEKCSIVRVEIFSVFPTLMVFVNRKSNFNKKCYFEVQSCEKYPKLATLILSHLPINIEHIF